MRQISAFAQESGEPGPSDSPVLSMPSVRVTVTAVCRGLWLASATFQDTIGKCWALVSEWCLLNPSYQGNLAAPVIVTTEKLTLRQGACCTYIFSCSLISIRCIAWFPQIHWKVWCDLAMLTEEVNGRDQGCCPWALNSKVQPPAIRQVAELARPRSQLPWEI